MPESTLPEVLAKPWVKVSKTLGRPPILSYASYCLDNWFKINEDEEISLDNVALITNFLGGVDPQRVQQWQQLYTTALERLERNDREDQFSGSPLQIRGDTTVEAAFSSNIIPTINNNG